MSAPKIKRNVLHYQKRTRELLVKGRVTMVSIVQAGNGEILSVGVDHSAAVEHIPKDRGDWEVKQFELWR